MWKFALELRTALQFKVQLLAGYSPGNCIDDLPHFLISIQLHTQLIHHLP